MAATPASEAFRAHLDELMAAKAGGRDVATVAARGAALIVALRADETSALVEGVAPKLDADGARARVESAEEELLALRYRKARCVAGITASRSGAAALALPDGLLTAEEAEASGAGGSAAPATADGHGSMLRRLAAEHGERARLAAEREEAQLEMRRRRGAATAQRSAEAASRAQLESVVFAADALRKGLGAPAISPADDAAEALCSRLPDPLFNLYRQAEAWAPGGGGAPARLSLREGAPPGAGADPLFAAAAVVVELRACDAKAASLSFSFHPAIRAIGVTCDDRSRDESLRSLFSDDDARGLPDERCLLRALPAQAPEAEPARRQASSAFDQGVEAMAPALPFRWAQWLGGLGPPLGDGREVHSIHAVMDALCGWLVAA